MRQLGLLVLLPDFMVQDHWAAADAILARNGIDVVACRSKILSKGESSYLYYRNARKLRAEEYASREWLARHVCTLDATVAVVVSMDTSRSIHDVLTELKGPSSSLNRPTNCLRAVSRAAEPGIALIHTPDDESDFREGVQLFFPGVSNATLASHPAGTLALTDIKRLRAHVPVRDISHRNQIMLGVMARIVFLLRTDIYLCALIGAADTATALSEAYEAFAAKEAPTPGQDAVRTTMDRAKTLSAHITDRLRNDGDLSPSVQAIAIARLNLTLLLTMLLEAQRPSDMTGDRTKHILSENGLYLDPWEEHLLHVSIEFTWWTSTP
jgi:hypothetical protein